MDVAWTVKYITEFIGTALLIIFGNGAVANVNLKGAKGNNSGWVIIALGYGFGVMVPTLMFGNVSGNRISPAFTLALAISGLLDWPHVPQYIIAQLLGAMFGQLLVVITHEPYYLKTENPDAIPGSFSTISVVDDGTKEGHKAAWINGFLNEFLDSFIFFFGVMALTKNYFGAELVAKLTDYGYDAITAASQIASYTTGPLTAAHLGLGLFVMTLAASLGGPTGPDLNPARDLDSRIVHALLPRSVLGEHKGDSRWWYSWVPVITPTFAGIVVVALFKLLYL